MENLAPERSLSFGGFGGGFSPVQDTGDQWIIFKGGNEVDSIQIGNTVYGGDGGSVQGKEKLPTSGTFRLKEIRGNSKVICYLKVQIGDNIIEVGRKNDDNTNLVVDMDVKITGIWHGNVIDNLEFEIVSI
jgi:hypothetical protein